MIKARKWLLLGLYIVAAAVVFAYYLFPSEAVKGYIAYRLNAADPNLTVEIASVKPSFPPGLRLKSVHLVRAGSRLAYAQQLVIKPAYASLLGPEKTYRFTGRLYAGTVTGNIHLNETSGAGAIQLDARIMGIKTEQIPVIVELSGRKVFGTLGGDIEVHRSDDSSLEAEADLELTDGKIELLTPVFTYKSLTFKSVQAEVAVTRQALEIKSCQITGQPANGDISGKIIFNAPFSKSILDLEGTVRPQPAFLMLLRKSLPASLVPRTSTGDDGIGIAFSGTLDSPEFAFR